MAAAAFQESQSQQFGRHLVAARHLDPGQTVLEQHPYAVVLYDEQVPLRCDWCLQPASQPGCPLLRCTRSRFAHYCCRDHQKAAWKAYYRQECKALVACAPRVPPATVRLAARVLWRRDSELQTGNPQQQQQLTGEARLRQQLSGGTFADVASLLSHWQQLDDGRKLQYAQMAALTRDFMHHSLLQGNQQDKQQQLLPPEHSNSSQPEPGTTSFAADDSGASNSSAAADVRQIALLIARFACNNHTVCDDELRPVGVGLYPLGALVNHDCRPNCVQTFTGRSIVFRSLQPIPAGQQLAISYIELAATRQERRRQLLEQYFFDIDLDKSQRQQQQQQQQQLEIPAAARVEEQQEQQEQQQQHAGGPATAQVEPAAGCKQSGSLQDSGLHKLHLLVKLPRAHPAGLQQQDGQQELQLWTSGCGLALHQQGSQLSGSGTDSVVGPAVVAGSSNRPPWPQDRPDPQLCEMLLRKQGGGVGDSSSSGSSSGAGQQQVTKLPGGMCLLQQLPGDEGAGRAAGAAADAFLSSLFRDLEQLGGSDSNAADPLDAAWLSQQLSPSQQQQQQQPQQQQHLEAVQWSDWRVVAQQQQVPSAASLAAAGAGLLLQVWQLQQQAERLTRGGDAAAAVKLCEAALAAADGHGPQPMVSQVPAAAAVADGARPDGQLVPHSSSTGSPVGSSGVRVVLGPQHVLRIRVLAALLCAAVDAAEWQLALQAAVQLTPLYNLVYPQVWPNLGLHYAMLAKLQMLLEQPAAAAQAAEAAAAILRVTHGSSSPVLQEVARTRYEAGQELAASARILD